MTQPSRRQFLMATGAFLAGARPKFSGQFGLEIYSLRREAQKDLPATLAMIRKFGITDLEVGELYGRSAQEFRRLDLQRVRVNEQRNVDPGLPEPRGTHGWR